MHLIDRCEKTIIRLLNGRKYPGILADTQYPVLGTRNYILRYDVGQVVRE